MQGMKFSIPGRPTVEGEGWVRVEGDPLPHPVSIRVALDADGRLVATGLLIEADRELSARDLRFPLATVVAGLASDVSKPRTRARLLRERLAAFGIKLRVEGGEPSESASDANPMWRWLLPLAGRRIPARTRSRTHDDAFYRGVAAAYAQAQREHPKRPIQALMEALGYEEAQTHRHLRAARKLIDPHTGKSFIPPTRGRSTAGKEQH